MDGGGGTGGASDNSSGTTSTAEDGGASSGGGNSGGAGAGGDGGKPTAEGGVYVVLFTHIEDSSPGGTLGSSQAETSYLALRTKMIEVAMAAEVHNLQWVLQPDWKFLEAALLYEDAEVTASTGGKNLFVYLREELNVAIDPHSHENGGYNYTDVAYLLDQLGVGGSTVIGGHIWDPSLPQFQEWDRFRDPQPGEQYPQAMWRGDVLIGAGTPNHVNDPLVSGVWRPLDRDNFFTDDPSGNVVALGAWHDDIAGVEELVALRENGDVPSDVMLTSSWNLQPVDIMAAGGVEQLEAEVFVPIAALRDQGAIVVTDFTSLVETWTTQHGAEAFIYQPPSN